MGRRRTNIKTMTTAPIRIAKGPTNNGDREFSVYLRRTFASPMGYSREMLDRPIAGRQAGSDRPLRVKVFRRARRPSSACERPENWTKRLTNVSGARPHRMQRRQAQSFSASDDSPLLTVGKATL